MLMLRPNADHPVVRDHEPLVVVVHHPLCGHIHSFHLQVVVGSMAFSFQTNIWGSVFIHGNYVYFTLFLFMMGVYDSGLPRDIEEGETTLLLLVGVCTPRPPRNEIEEG